MENEELLNQYTEVRECEYKDRRYLARDNGAICRLPKVMWRQFSRLYDKASTSYAMPIKSKNIRMVSSSGSGMTSGLKSHLE